MDTSKWTNIHIVEIREGEKEKGAKCVFKEIMAKNFPTLGKEIDIQIQEAHRESQLDESKGTHTKTH